jgi:hypothetical protein
MNLLRVHVACLVLGGRFSSRAKQGWPVKDANRSFHQAVTGVVADRSRMKSGTGNMLEYFSYKKGCCAPN